MRPSLYLSAVVCLAFLIGNVLGAALQSTAFKPTCKKPNYPSPAPAKAPAIDSECGLQGSGTGAEGAQNAAKNNFCASGPAKAITINDLIALQQMVEADASINFGDQNTGARKKGPTADRTALNKLGEGKQVTLKAYVLIARQEGGESVNCGKGVSGENSHDIHISLVGSADTTSECAGTVAEMSPHMRPDSWTHLNVQKVADAKLPVRVTGHLFFDSSHVPCAGGQKVRSNPMRASLWEIHPVYKFEVCTADCDGEGKWLPLDQWVKKK
jgi:hypothetical protein